MCPGEADDGRIHGETQGPGGGSAEAYCALCNSSFPTTQITCPVDGSQLVMLPEQRDDMLGRVLEGRFEIREHIGAGGMGSVYRAFQSSVGRDVAIKVIDATVSRDREAVKRFMREAQLASKLSHANTIVVHDFGQTHDGVVYLVMELIEGKTLRELLTSTGAMPKALLVRLGIQMCDALATAHNMGIVHRDLKPGNVMILDGPAGREQLKVLDFGLAKSLAQDTTQISSSHVRMGTPMYMSPEMIRAEEVDARSDLYALGCTLYEMAAGRPPFLARSAEVLFAQHLEDPPEPLDRADLGPIGACILQLLAKEAVDRPVNAEAVRAVLSGETSDSASTLPAVKRKPHTDSMERLAQAVTLDADDTTVPKPAATSQSRRGVLALAALLAVGGGATLYALNRGGGDDDAGKRREASTPAAAVVDAAPKTAPPQPTATQMVTLTLRSDPSSQVSVAGKVVGNTPIVHRVAQSDAQVEVVFRLDGYISERRRISPNGNQLIELALKRQPRKRTKRRIRRTSRTKTKPKPTVEPKPKPKIEPKPKVEPKAKPNDPEPIFRLKKKP